MISSVLSGKNAFGPHSGSMILIGNSQVLEKLESDANLEEEGGQQLLMCRCPVWEGGKASRRQSAQDRGSSSPVHHPLGGAASL